MNDREHSKPSPEDPVEKILQLAGPRTAIETAVKAEVKSAVRAQWQSAVIAQRRLQWWRRGVGTVLAAAAVWVLVMVGAGIWRPLGGPAPVLVASLVNQMGEVNHFLNKEESWDGRRLLAGETLATGVSAEEPSRALLELLDGTTIRLDSSSRIRFVAPGVLDLEQGTVYVATLGTSAGSNSSVEIRTPLGIARDIGTRFEVNYQPVDQQLSIRVRQGEVVLQRNEKAPLRAVEGQELVVAEDGLPEKNPVDIHDDSWAWTPEIFRSFDANGRSLDEFLQWPTKEAGWELRYADDLEQDARDNILGGSIDEMTIPEAVDYFLKASSLQSRLDRGVLWIEEKNVRSF